MTEFIDTLFTPLGTTGSYRAIADLHTSQFTVTHALRFSVFTSRILETEFITVCHFKPNRKPSFHSLIPFLPLFCNCQLNPIPLLPSSYPGRLASRNSTLLYAASLQPFRTDHAENTASLFFFGRRVYSAVA
jgi:hypothetical protein